MTTTSRASPSPPPGGRPPSGRRPGSQEAQAAKGRRTAVWIGLTAALCLLGVALVVRPQGGEGVRQDQVSAEAFVGGDLHSLVADPQRPGRLYVGGHAAVATSADGGATWSPVDSLRGADAMGWAFGPDGIRVSGHPGLSRSSDGGRTFVPASTGLPSTDVHAFGGGGSVLYGASPAVGVFASADGGTTWEVRATATGQAFFGRILVDPSQPDHLVAADVRAGPVESSDGGRSWNPLGGLAGATWVTWGADRAILIASGPRGAARSSDGGRSWEPLPLPDGAVIVEASSGDDATIYAGGLVGTSARIWVSRDAGRTWNRP